MFSYHFFVPFLSQSSIFAVLKIVSACFFYAVGFACFAVHFAVPFLKEQHSGSLLFLFQKNGIITFSVVPFWLPPFLFLQRSNVFYYYCSSLAFRVFCIVFLFFPFLFQRGTAFAFFAVPFFYHPSLFLFRRNTSSILLLSL